MSSDSGELKVEISRWTGRPRLRCVACDKVAFATREQAQDAVKKIQGDRKTTLFFYQGPKCGQWHLTRMPQKKGRIT